MWESEDYREGFSFRDAKTEEEAADDFIDCFSGKAIKLIVVDVNDAYKIPLHNGKRVS
jgi:hypothetical protein